MSIYVRRNSVHFSKLKNGESKSVSDHTSVTHHTSTANVNHPTMDQVEAQLKKIRTKLDDVPAFQQAEVSWPCLGGWTRSWEEELAVGWPKIPFVAEDGPRG